MSEKKIKVPEGMLKAFLGGREEPKERVVTEWTPERSGLEAALRWLSENPIVPTDEQLASMFKEFPEGPSVIGPKQIIELWQRRCFLAPESEVPDEIKDMLWNESPRECVIPKEEGAGLKARKLHNKEILEAYRRGYKSTRESYRFGFTGFKPVDHPILTEWLAAAKDKGVDQATQVNYRRLFERAFEAGKKEGGGK